MFEFSLRQRIQADPYYRFQSIRDIRIAAQLGIRINVNRAGVDDWLRLPGLSIHQARNLVQLTQSGVAFYSVRDLAAALSVTPDQIQPWEPILSFQYFDPKSLDAAPKLNLNTATVEDLRSLFPNDPELSQQIVDERSQRGTFQNFADFQARLRLSADFISQLIHIVQCY
jgi:DNA uptake protein ComE-like DNA-binding protein